MAKLAISWFLVLMRQPSAPPIIILPSPLSISSPSKHPHQLVSHSLHLANVLVELSNILPGTYHLSTLQTTSHTSKMKTYIAVAALVAVAQAQDTSSLAPCIVSQRVPLESIGMLTVTQQTCVSNMLGLAASLGCPDASATCLCTKPEFSFGIVDCSTESCPSGTDVGPASSYVSTFCVGVSGKHPVCL